MYSTRLDLLDGGHFFSIFAEPCFLGSRRVRSREFHDGDNACSVFNQACDPCVEYAHDVIIRVFVKVRSELAAGLVENPVGFVRTVAGTVSEDLARERRVARGGLAKPNRLAAQVGRQLTEPQRALLRAMLFHAAGDSRPEADPWPYDYFAAQPWAVAAGWHSGAIAGVIDHLTEICRRRDRRWTERNLDDQLQRRRIELGRNIDSDDWGDLTDTDEVDELGALLDQACRDIGVGHQPEPVLLGLVERRFGSTARIRLQESEDLPPLVSWLNQQVTAHNEAVGQ